MNTQKKTELKNFYNSKMSYQTRLDQLESEVFQNNTLSTSLPLSRYLPFVIIAIVSLLTLYTFCPRSLQTLRNQRYHINLERFSCCWLILTSVLCVLYAFFLHKRSEISTA